MWKNNKFVADRDPARGGLHILYADPGIKEETLREISSSFLELIARDYEHPCSCIYPLSSGQNAAAMAMKISGSKKDPRPHDMIRGVIINRREMPDFLKHCASPGQMRELFFPQAPDPDRPEDWVIKTGMHTEHQDLFSGKNYEYICGLCSAVCEVAKQHLHIQLLVDDSRKETELLRCLCMAEQARVRLFMMADGECTMKNPDILILDKIMYQDAGIYRQMTLKEFLEIGKGRKRLPVSGHVSEEERRFEEALILSLNYITQPQISDFELYEYLGKMQSEQPVLYRQFIRSLRKSLYEFHDAEHFLERYIKLLYIAYKKYPGEIPAASPELETAPYDFTGMNYFLQEKARTKRELRKMQLAMLTVQFQACLSPADQKAADEAARRTVNMVE